MQRNNEIDFDDIQGIIRFGHGKLSQASFVLVNIRNNQLAKSWIASAPVTSAVKTKPVPNTALQLAFTVKGLREMGLDHNIIQSFSDEFVTGMTGGNRPRRLGDVGANDPANWQWGFTDSLPDLLIMLYAKPNELKAWEAQIINDGFSQAFTVLRKLDTNGQVDREPFGFVDGISQPKIDWDQRQSIDFHDRSKFSNVMAPGEVLLGYPNEYGKYTDRPLVNNEGKQSLEILPDATDMPGHQDLGRNGSYLIFRQLKQDVSGFWEYVNAAAKESQLNAIELAESMVGRKQDGSPLMPKSLDPIPGVDTKNKEINQFNYDHDPQGTTCPIGAHVRRSNPRSGDLPPTSGGLLTRIKQIFGFDDASRSQDLVASTRFHRILRRGRPYGENLHQDPGSKLKSDDVERGIHFICLSANIARQFEFVQNAWINSAKFSGLQDESDPLLGNRQPLANGTKTDQVSLAQSNGARHRFESLPQFVSVCGGAYFFIPGMRALKYLTQLKMDAKG